MCHLWDTIFTLKRKLLFSLPRWVESRSLVLACGTWWSRTEWVWLSGQASVGQFKCCNLFIVYRYVIVFGTVYVMWVYSLNVIKCCPTWRSRIRASWYNYENNQQDAIYRLIYYSKSTVHVSGDVFAHHQEHLTVFTVYGCVHPRWCRLVSWMSWNWTMWIKHYQIL